VAVISLKQLFLRTRFRHYYATALMFALLLFSIVVIIIFAIIIIITALRITSYINVTDRTPLLGILTNWWESNCSVLPYWFVKRWAYLSACVEN